MLASAASLPLPYTVADSQTGAALHGRGVQKHDLQAASGQRECSVEHRLLPIEPSYEGLTFVLPDSKAWPRGAGLTRQANGQFLPSPDSFYGVKRPDGLVAQEVPAFGEDPILVLFPSQNGEAF